MYAVIEESGKQFKVSTGDTIRIDRHELVEEKQVTFDKVLFVGGGEAASKIGAPTVGGATVVADVIGAAKGPKLTMQKYKRPQRLLPQARPSSALRRSKDLGNQRLTKRQDGDRLRRNTGRLAIEFPTRPIGFASARPLAFIEVVSKSL